MFVWLFPQPSLRPRSQVSITCVILKLQLDLITALNVKMSLEIHPGVSLPPSISRYSYYFLNWNWLRPEQPPYLLNIAQIGGLPTVSEDIPPVAVFLGLYTFSTIISILLFEHQRRRRLSCTIPIVLFLFSGERVLTCILRIVWAFNLTSVRIAVATQIFLQAGVLLLFLLNLILAKEVWLGRQPGARTRRALTTTLITFSTLTISALIMVIASIIVSVYTLDHKVITNCRDVQRAGATYFLVLAATPLIMLALAFSTSPTRPAEAQVKLRDDSSLTVITVVSSVLCVLNAGFKTGVVWAAPRPLFDPAWYHSRACLYTFVFTTEICVLVLLYSTRVDLRFQRAKDRGNTYSSQGITDSGDGK